MEIVVQTEKLTKMYGKQRGISDVDLTIYQGEIFGFIGPNGAGKSTTIRTLLSLIYPTSGSAKIFGLDTIEGHEAILQQVGYLPAEVFYYDHMKVKDLLKYAASFYHQDCSKRINELANRLDLDLNRKIADLSLGNKKKVGIIQGLLHEPELIILDEPTSGLDPLMQNTFFEIIREEQQRGATVFFSSHILSEVQKLCDRVAIIKDGRIIKIETMADLAQTTYKHVELELETSEPVEFAKLEVTNFEVTGTKVSFLFNGDINALVQVLATYKLKNLQVSEPDLEAIFFHYYE
ncbi:MAG: ABC transporter ATP-binding protein [Culicoidibacterales bacterium]